MIISIFYIIIPNHPSKTSSPSYSWVFIQTNIWILTELIVISMGIGLYWLFIFTSASLSHLSYQFSTYKLEATFFINVSFFLLYFYVVDLLVFIEVLA